jgi:hypothetical protein
MNLSPNNGLKKMYIGNGRRYTIQKLCKLVKEEAYKEIKDEFKYIINEIEKVQNINHKNYKDILLIIETKEQYKFCIRGRRKI